LYSYNTRRNPLVSLVSKNGKYKLTHGDDADPYHSFRSGSIKFPMAVATSTSFTTVVTTVVSTVEIPVIVSVKVVTPVPIVLVSNRVGGFDVLNQSYTCSRH
jgi:hypothetical protein